MKRSILTSLISAFSVLLMQAAVKTVSNDPSTPAQFTGIQFAVNACSVGDTVYVNGSKTDYGNFTINKRLTIIGPGYDPTGYDNATPATVNVITFDSIAPALISGSNIIGLAIENDIYYASGDRGVIHNVSIQRCYFKLGSVVYVSGNNWLIKNNIHDDYIDVGNYKNIVIANNFLGSHVRNSNHASNYLINNICTDIATYGFYTVSNLNVYNNIYRNSAISGCTNCVFNNNITDDEVVKEFPGLNNTGTGNLNNVDPKYVSTLPATTSSIPIADFKKYDWHLQVSSPGHNAGTDGTDIGVYGGSYLWPGFTGMSNLPLVQILNIKNPTVQKEGTLKVSIKANKQQ